MQAVGGGMGLLGGLFQNQTEGSRDAGNVFAIQNPEQQQAMQQRATGELNTTQAANGVQNNSIYSPLFGQGGIMQQTANQEQQQASQPWALTDQDKSAYGQISGDIARQFGQSDQSLAQALSNRGMSNSGAAGAAFSGSQGNKLEQLAQTQQNIAQQRFNSNLQRLGQTQQFLGQLGAQGQGAMGQMLGAQQNNIQNAQGYLQRQADQSNQNLAQQQSTAHGNSMSNALTGGIAGMAAMNKGSGGKPTEGVTS